jgi:hypothetical protein
MEFEFDLTKNKDTTENINYNYYSTTFYKNQYEKTIQHGGYIKLPYPSHPNKPNIVSSVFPDHYVTTHLYILKKIHSIHGINYDGELVIEHISTTNSNQRLYTCLLLKSSPTSSFTKIDDLISKESATTTTSAVTIDLNDFFMMESIKEAILYDTNYTKVIVFTQPILVNSSFESISSVELFPSYSSNYSVLSVKPLLGINHVQVEGFKEGINEDVVAAAYCQPIDETDPSISENADVVIPLNSRLSVNDATNNSMKTILNFFAFFVMILAAVVLVPIIYNRFIVDLVLDNKELLEPQQKLNRLCSIDIYVSIILLGFAFSFINYGIANNVPVFTSVGFYVLIFYLASFLYFQYNRTMNTDFVKKFGEPLASFDNVKNDIGNLIIDNLKILVMNFKTKQEEQTNDKGFVQTKNVLIKDENGEPVKEFGFVNLFLLGGVYFVLYMIANYAGMNKSVGASSVLLSLPFYLFLFALYICIFIKYQRDRRILEDNKKNSP